MNDLAGVPLPLIFVVSVALILAASEVGHRLGTSTGDRVGNNLSTLEAAILGLLALMISFTFAMALSRFDARREAVLNEANAIGTTALRARLLPAPHNTQCLTLLREYVRVRRDITRRNPSAAELAAAVNRSNEIQEALWQQAKAVAVRDTALVPTGYFIESLNHMIDVQEQRLTAVRNRVPNIVILSLYGIAAVALGFTGYAGGLGDSNSHTHSTDCCRNSSGGSRSTGGSHHRNNIHSDGGDRHGSVSQWQRYPQRGRPTPTRGGLQRALLSQP